MRPSLAPSNYLLASLLLTAVACAADTSDSKKNTIQEPDALIPWIATPTTDGKISEGEYEGALRVEIDGLTPDENPGWNPYNKKSIAKDDLSFTLLVGHDGKCLYVAFDITDNSICSDNVPYPRGRYMGVWEDDCAEICLDGDLDRDAITEGSRRGDALGDEDWQEGFVPHYGIPDDVYFDDGHGAYGTGDGEWFARTRLLDEQHWQVEYRVPFTLIDTKNGPGIKPAKPGDLIGFNAMINDDDHGGAREQQVSWNGMNHENQLYLQQSAWLIVKLAEAKVAEEVAPDQESE